MNVVLMMIGFAFLTCGHLLGGNTTKPGGVLVLLSIVLFSVAVGWGLRDSLKGGDKWKK